MSEAVHPNAALVRRVFAAFGQDAMAISAAFARDIVWRVPGNTAMSGEYRGRREVVEFLRRTGLETGGTYRSHLHTVFADDDWAVAIYRATGSRNGVDLDIEQFWS
jgi:ketosteroid isomerase-like protein